MQSPVFPTSVESPFAKQVASKRTASCSPTSKQIILVGDKMELNFSGIVSNSKLSKKQNGRKAFGTAAFIPSPPLACRAMKNIICELWHAQHLCLLLCDHLSTWPKHHQAKSILQVAVPATQTLSHYYCQDEGLCCATGQWHFGYPPWDSCTKPDPTTLCSCSLG